MEWHQLEYFKIVAKLQHFTRAAEALSISQPALSRSIAKLEEELGVPLFERQGRNVILNRYGQIFLGNVEQAMQEIAAGKQKLKDLIDPDYGSVSLAFLHSFGNHLVPELLSKFHMNNPSIKFNLYQNATNVILDQLEAGKIDLCLSSSAITRERIEWAALFTEELFIIVPKGHRLSGNDCIRLDEIADEPIITFKKDYGLRTIADQLFQESGFSPKVTFEGEEITTVAGLVEAKLGVAMIPKIPGLDNNISFLRVIDPRCYRVIGIAWIRDRYLSPAANKFKQFVIDSFK